MGDPVRVLAWGEFDENTCVVGDDAACVVIDPGAPAAKLAPLIGGRRVAAILVTHTHLDHIFGVDELREATGAPVWAPEGEARGFVDPQFNLSGLFGSDIRRRPADQVFRGGRHFDAGSIRLEVRDVPGHSPGHVVFVGQGFVIAGDTLFAGSIGRTDFPGSSHRQLLQSIRSELMTLPDETIVYPGHGPRTTIGTERKYNPFLRS